MEKVFTLVDFKNDSAVLRDENNGDGFLWPKKNLPKNIKIGDKINFLISLDEPDVAQRKQKARDLLNEILKV